MHLTFRTSGCAERLAGSCEYYFQSLQYDPTGNKTPALCNKHFCDQLSCEKSILVTTILAKTSSTVKRKSGPAPRGGQAPPIHMLGPPINKLTLLKTAAFALNFKLWPPQVDCSAAGSNVNANSEISGVFRIYKRGRGPTFDKLKNIKLQ